LIRELRNTPVDEWGAERYRQLQELSENYYDDENDLEGYLGYGYSPEEMRARNGYEFGYDIFNTEDPRTFIFSSPELRARAIEIQAQLKELDSQYLDSEEPEEIEDKIDALTEEYNNLANQAEKDSDETYRKLKDEIPPAWELTKGIPDQSPIPEGMTKPAWWDEWFWTDDEDAGEQGGDTYFQSAGEEMAYNEGAPAGAENQQERPLTPEENIQRGSQAMERVISEHTDVLNAMYREDVGDISLFWGTSGKGGWGVAHILERRDAEHQRFPSMPDGLAVAQKMVDVIANGEITQRYQGKNRFSDRVRISYDGYTAILRLFKDRQSQTWLLTGWEDYKRQSPDASGEGVNSAGATLAGPTGIRPGEGAGDSAASITPEEQGSNKEMAEAVRKAFEQQDGQQTAPNAMTELLGEFTSLMTFFETANPSSPPHEFMHHVLNIYDKLSDMDGVEDWLKQDYDTILKEFGAAKNIDMTKEQFRNDEELRTEAHEWFAKGFEVYMATGEAPNSTLKKVFERMKRWLIDIYGDIKEVLGVEVSDTMKEIYDRMLASPEEITAEYEARTKLGDLAAEAAIIKERIAEYEAEERASGENDRAWAEFDSAWLFEDLDEIALESVEGYLAYLDEWKARKAERGEREATLARIKEAGHLTYDSLVHEVGREAANEIRKKLPDLFSKKGLEIDVLAEAAGMDLRDFVKFLEDWTPNKQKSPIPLLEVNTDTLNALIDRMGIENTREYLAQRKRYLLNLQKGLQTEYESDKNNDQKRQDLERTYTELKEIGDSTKALDAMLKDPEAKNRKTSGENQAAEGRVVTEKPRSVTLEEAMKYGFETAERYTKSAYREGVKKGRADARQQARERLEKLKARQREKAALRKEINSLVKGINKMADSENISWDVMRAIQEKLSGYDLKRRRQDVLDRRAELEEYLEANPEAGDSMSARDLKYLGTTTLNDMTIEDVRKLAAEIEAMHEQGRREYIEWEAARKERVDKINAALRATLEKTPVKLPMVKKSPQDVKKQYDGVLGKLEQISDWGYAASLGAQRFFDWLDGGATKYDGPFVKTFVDAVNKARDAELRHVFERRNWIQARLRELGLNMANFSRIRARDIAGKNFTVDEIMEIYIGMRNPKKAAAILSGVLGDERITDPQAVVDNLVSRLTDAEKAAAELVVQDHDRNADRIERAFIEAFNHGFEREVNYTAIHRVEHGSPQGLIDAESADALAQGKADAGFLQGRVQDGFTKSRVTMDDDKQTGITLGLFSNWHDDVSVHEHSAAFASMARDTVGALMAHDPVKGKTIGRMIQERKGDEAWRTLVSFFNAAVQNDARMAHNVLNSAAGFMAKNMSITYLAGNLLTVLKQTTSIPRFLITAGPHRIMAAIGKFSVNPMRFLEEVYEMDPQMRDRAGSEMLRAIRQDPNWGKRGYSRILRWAMQPISMMDRWVAAIGWRATYDANLKELGKEKAIREAQRAVALTQQTAHAKDSPAMWRQNGYVRLIMLFTADAAQTFGMTAYDFVQQVRTGQGRKVVATLTALTLTAMCMKAASDGLPWGDEDDDDDETSGWGQWTAEAVGEQAISSIPLVGKEAIALYDAVSGNYRGTQYSAIISPIEKLIRAAKIMTKEELEEGDGWKATDYALEALSLSGVPVPYTAIKRAAQSLVYLNDYDPLAAAFILVGKRIPREE
jgi:hypothetical protein